MIVHKILLWNDYNTHKEKYKIRLINAFLSHKFYTVLQLNFPRIPIRIIIIIVGRCFFLSDHFNCKQNVQRV